MSHVYDAFSWQTRIERAQLSGLHSTFLFGPLSGYLPSTELEGDVTQRCATSVGAIWFSHRHGFYPLAETGHGHMNFLGTKALRILLRVEVVNMTHLD